MAQHGLVATLIIGFSRGSYDPAARFESAPLFGSIDHDAYYYADVLVGTPPQRVSVILDTGSSISAFPCASCPHCGKHIDPNFDFVASTTAQWVSCTDGLSCGGICRKGRCSYYQGYTEGSSIRGFYFEDRVQLGDAQQNNPPAKARFGCHQNENKLFYTQAANGIMGISPSSFKHHSLLEVLFGGNDVNMFAVCLSDWGGRFFVGGYNSSYHTEATQWVPMTTSTVYRVNLTEMYIYDKKVTAFTGHAVVDTGTTYVYLASQPYRALRIAIESYCRKYYYCGGSVQHGTCWDIPEGALHTFPNITVAFGNTITVWEARSYMFEKVGFSNKRWCYAFQDDGPSASTTLGAAWLTHHDVIFDLTAKRLGIAAANCPRYYKRPNPPAKIDIPTMSVNTTPTKASAISSTTMIAPIAGTDTNASMPVIDQFGQPANNKEYQAMGVHLGDIRSRDASKDGEAVRAHLYQCLFLGLGISSIALTCMYGGRSWMRRMRLRSESSHSGLLHMSEQTSLRHELEPIE